MGVLRNLPDQCFAIGLGHPVFGFDAYAFVYALLERLLGPRQLVSGTDGFDSGFNKLRIHDDSLLFYMRHQEPAACLALILLFNTKILISIKFYYQIRHKTEESRVGKKSVR